MMCAPGNQFFTQVLSNSPYNYLEIGVFNGDGLSTLAKFHSNKIIFGIDPFIEDGCTTGHSLVKENEFMSTQKENTHKNIEGLHNVVLFETTSAEFANMLTEEMIAEMNIGWVLIDGSHHYKDVIIDCDLAMRLIGDRPGGVVFDDLNLPGPKQAYDEFLEKYHGRYGKVLDIYPEIPNAILAHPINQ